MGNLIKMKKVLITGANGYLGSVLTKTLLAEGYFVNALIRKRQIKFLKNSRLKIFYGDLDNQKILEQAVKDVEIVFHLAAALNIFEHDKLLYHTNIIGLKNLLGVCQQSKKQTGFIFTSSVDVLTKKSDYAKSKVEGEKIVKEFCRNKNIKYTIVRVGNVDSLDNNSGVSYGVIDIIKKNNWKSSILYHCLGHRKIYPVEIKTLIKKLINLSSNINNQTVNIFRPPITIKQVTITAKKKKVVEAIPSKLILGQTILFFWQIIAKILKRGDLLVYFNLSK